jgi:hypothetical protein
VMHIPRDLKIRSSRAMSKGLPVTSYIVKCRGNSLRYDLVRVL